MTQTAQEMVEQLLAQWLFQPQVDQEEVRRCAASLGFSASDGASGHTSTSSTLELYRQLIRGTVEDAIRGVLPITCARLSTQLPLLVADFLAQNPPRQDVLRSLVLEFQSHVSQSDVPAYLDDLMRFESDCAEIGTAPEPAPPTVCVSELSLAATTRFRNYNYQVHKLNLVPIDQLPQTHPCSLILYRDRDLEVVWVELNPEQARVLQQVLSGAALEPTLTALRESGVAGVEKANAAEELEHKLQVLLDEGGMLRSAPQVARTAPTTGL